MNMQELKNKLETIIDSNSVATILEAMSQISYEKAQHIQESYQDKHLAGTWTIAGNQLSKLADKIVC